MRGRRLASFRMTMSKQELEDALARKQRSDTDRMDWLEKQAAFAVLASNREDHCIDWECAWSARKEIDAAMDAEER